MPGITLLMHQHVSSRNEENPSCFVIVDCAAVEGYSWKMWCNALFYRVNFRLVGLTLDVHGKPFTCLSFSRLTTESESSSRRNSASAPPRVVTAEYRCSSRCAWALFTCTGVAQVPQEAVPSYHACPLASTRYAPYKQVACPTALLRLNISWMTTERG